MKQFVLEILDGDLSGTVVDLGEGRLSVGRRPDNDIVLVDEKCSGHHAEIVFEDGRHVLRDLGSTNGTMLDGRRVQEVVLSARDIFTLGRIRAVYRAADDASAAAGADLSDFQVGRIDASTIARSGRRRGSLVWTVLFVAVVAAGGLFAWRTYFSGEQVSGPSRRQPMTVAGNRLSDATANLEEEGGWDLQPVVEAAPFDVSVGRARAHTGNAALAAARVEAQDGAQARIFALARTSETVQVASDQPVRISAWVRTMGQARVALRAVFGAGEEAVFVRTGSAPTRSPDGYTELSFDVRAPLGADRVAVEILGFVSGGDDEVLVDDIAVRFEGEAVAIGGSAGGSRLFGSGASVRVEGIEVPYLLDVVPLPGSEPVLMQLAALGLLVPSDAGLTLEATVLEGETGYRLAWSGDSTTGLALDLPTESASVRTRGADRFELRDPQLEVEGVRELVCGGAGNRTAIVLPEPASVRGVMRPGSWRVELPGTSVFELRTVFTDDVVSARELVRRAAAARDAGRPDQALARVDQLIAEAPYDVSSLRRAQELRAEVLAAQQREVEILLREGGEAAFFDARVGYQRVIADIDATVARYGVERVGRYDELTGMRGRMEEGLAALDARDGLERVEMLGLLAGAFEKAGDKALAAFVRSYVERRLPDVGPGEQGEQVEQAEQEKDK